MNQTLTSKSAADRATRRLSRQMLETVGEHKLLEAGDRILIGLSGGKDSYTLIDLLSRALRKAPIEFELFAYHLDQAQPGHDVSALESWVQERGFEYEIERVDTYSTVIEKTEAGGSFCRICSRLRRGVLYSAAERHGCNKVALGHHRDDALETLLLNLFYAGKLQAMPAGYRTNDDKFQVIRPLIECAETDIITHAEREAYPILPCRLCGSQDDLKRERMKELLVDLEKQIPNLRSVMVAALKNVRPTHLLDAEVSRAWLAMAGEFEPRR